MKTATILFLCTLVGCQSRTISKSQMDSAEDRFTGTVCTGWSVMGGSSFLWCRNQATEYHWLAVVVRPKVPTPWPSEMKMPCALIHMPPTGCPLGYKRDDDTFSKNGKPVSACRAKTRNAQACSDYLAAGESETF